VSQLLRDVAQVLEVGQVFRRRDERERPGMPARRLADVDQLDAEGNILKSRV